MISRDAYTGVVPVAVCGDLSGEACSLAVSADDLACAVGHPLLGRVLSAPPPVDGAPARRPQLAVHDEFDDELLGDPAERVRALIARPDLLAVARGAVQSFTDHHGVDDDRARAELRHLVVVALGAGDYRIDDRGFWRITHRGFRTRLVPPATVLLSYSTLHFERMPSEVFGDAPSRFGRGRLRTVDATGRGTTRAALPAELLDDDELRARLGADVVCTSRLAAAWARRCGVAPAEAALVIAGAVQSGLAAGRPLEPSDRADSRVLRAAGTSWAISRSDGVVVAAWPDPGTAAEPAR